MPRKSRIELPGSLHHIMARGISGQDIFIDEKDSIRFCQRLGELLSHSSNQCYAWALMRNHFHLLLRSGDEPLSRMMRRLLTGHAVYFNKRHKRSGHLFQNRFKSILCQEDRYFLELVRYIHLNPIRSGEIKNIDLLNEYPFTGHSCILGKHENDWQNVEFTLSWFGKRKKAAIKSYHNWVNDGLAEGKRNDLTGGGLLRTIGGWKNLQKLKQNGQSIWGDERMLGDSEFVELALKQDEKKSPQSSNTDIKTIDLNELAKIVCQYFEVDQNIIRSSSKNHLVLRTKSMLSYIAIRLNNHTGTDVANYLRLNKSSVSRMVSTFKDFETLDLIVKKIRQNQDESQQRNNVPNH